ncbi:MAG: shikimate dehydrogenase [Acidobacteria bacterium]|nr:MAG: shikimate dehydrogenase [Acidobacteriota bacterium]
MLYNNGVLHYKGSATLEKDLAKSPSPRIFVSLASPSLDVAEAYIETLGTTAPLGFELRLDYLQDHARLESDLHKMLARLRYPQTIATCRRVDAGGRFEGSVEDQLEVLSAAARAGCQWVDIEIESVKAVRKPPFKDLAPAKVIVSYHNYRNTPDLEAIYRRLARLPVEAVKIASHAQELQDNLKILKLLKSNRRHRPQLVALAMGNSGICSRVMAFRWGSPFTYASAGNHHAVAGGQLAIENMRSVYHVEHLDERTQLYGVVGTHSAMSLSPAMQNIAFQAKRVNALYLPCETARLIDFLKFARSLKFAGFSITMPFKRAIMKELDWIDPLAEQIGACNTVAIRHGKWMGWNTDSAAVVEVLTKRLRLPGSRILILGAGGAARAGAYALRAETADVFIAARRDAVARKLARAVGAEAVPWENADSLDVDAVINATPVGMAPHSDAHPIDLARLRTRVVFDMVYYPVETRFLSEARGRGLVTISGLEMLVAQGARQFEIWTGQPAPRALMEQAIRQSLNHAPPG